MLYHKTSKEASNVLCSVVKHLRSGEKHSTASRVFPYTTLPLPACFTTEQSTVEAS